MGGELIGLVAVTLGMGVPLGALYTYYRVRKLRSEERLAAIARGVDIPMHPELNEEARSGRPGIPLGRDGSTACSGKKKSTGSLRAAATSPLRVFHRVTLTPVGRGAGLATRCPFSACK